jgi:hypothetical protein
MVVRAHSIASRRGRGRWLEWLWAAVCFGRWSGVSIHCRKDMEKGSRWSSRSRKEGRRQEGRGWLTVGTESVWRCPQVSGSLVRNSAIFAAA